MSSAYIASLNRELAADARANEAVAPDLKQRFMAWYSALPEVSRTRAFAMREFEAALSSQGRYLGALLLELGWRRHRKWGKSGYHRFWVPPDL